MPSKDPTPNWLAPYLRYISWKQWELLNILCGLPPVPLGDLPPTPRKQLLDEATCRENAERHVQDAIRVGELLVEPSLANQRLLDSLTPHDADEPLRGDIQRAVVAARLYSEAYHVKVDVAIRWALSRRELFPSCPLTVEHLTVSTLSPRPSARPH